MQCPRCHQLVQNQTFQPCLVRSGHALVGRLALLLVAVYLQARTFIVQPLLSRTAYAVLHFLELLVGPRCQNLAVQNPQRYHFDKHQLLLSMVLLAGQLARYSEFTQASGDCDSIAGICCTRASSHLFCSCCHCCGAAGVSISHAGCAVFKYMSLVWQSC